MFVLPTVVMGAAILAVAPGSIDHTVWAVLIAHVIFNLAVVVRVVGAMWERLPRDMEAAAATLGASRTDVFRHVTLAQLRPAILGAASIVFVFTFTSYGVIRIARRTGHTHDRGRGMAQRHAARPSRPGRCPRARPAGNPRRCGHWATRRQRTASRAIALDDATRRDRPRTAGQRRFVATVAAATAVVLLAPLTTLVSRSLRTSTGWSTSAWTRLGRLEVRPGISLGIDPSAAIRVSLTTAAVATMIAVVIGALASVAIAGVGTDGPSPRHRVDPADRHLRRDDRLRHVDHVRHRPGRLAWFVVAGAGRPGAGGAAVRDPQLRVGAAGGRSEAHRCRRHAWHIADARLVGDRRAEPVAAARRWRRAGGRHLARRIRRDVVALALWQRDDADRDRTAARAHRIDPPGAGIRAGHDPRGDHDPARGPRRARHWRHVGTNRQTMDNRAMDRR